MKLLNLFAFAALVYGQVTPITGKMVYPNGAPFTGRIFITLAQPSVKNVCASGQQSFSPVTVQVPASGMVPTFYLYPSECYANTVGGANTVLPLAGAGTGGAAVLYPASDGALWSGDVTFNPGTGTAANTGVFRIGMTAPNLYTCYMQPANANATAAAATLTITTVTRQSATAVGRYLTVSSAGTMTPGMLYTWWYSCVQPYTVQVFDNYGNLQYQAQWVVQGASGSSLDISRVDFSQLVILQ